MVLGEGFPSEAPGASPAEEGLRAPDALEPD